MNKIYTLVILFLVMNSCGNKDPLMAEMESRMKNLDGTVVFIHFHSGKTTIYNPTLAHQRTTPASTFKIWNTMIGAELGLLPSAGEIFYQWDGTKRFLPEWNQDLTLGEAFRVSCVPAFQNLADKIGQEKMLHWIRKIHYGDMDISSGVHDFWLPKKEKKSIKISPWEQAVLIKKLFANELPFSPNNTALLKEIMQTKLANNAIVYGKTGTGKNVDDRADNNIGWYVGNISGRNGDYSFAVLLRGKDVSGKDARKILEDIVALSVL